MFETMKQKGKKATMLAATLLVIAGSVQGQLQTGPGWPWTPSNEQPADSATSPADSTIPPADSAANDVIENLIHDMNVNTTEVRRVGGNAAALAALKPLQYNPGQTTQVMAGVGTYRGQTAGALGVAHYTSQNLMYHAGMSLGGAHSIMANGGITIGFGPGKTAQREDSKVDMLQKTVDRLLSENAQVKAENAQIKVALQDIYAKLNNK